MVSAERLLDLIFFWMGHREEHAANLSLAAKEQHVTTKGSTGETAVLLQSSSSIRVAQRHDQKTSQNCSDIQQLFDQLKEQSASAQLKEQSASAQLKEQSASAQLKEQSASAQLKGASRLVMEQVLQGLGKYNSFSEDELNFGSLIRTEEWAPRIDRSLTKNLLKILAFFSLRVEDEDLQGLFREGFSEMKRNVVSALREDVKEITREGAELFPSSTEAQWEKLAQRVHVTDLSQSLHGVAEGMMKAVEELRKALTAISEAFVELKDVQECIVDPGCVCRRTKLLQYAHEHCRGHCGETEEQSGGADKAGRKRAAFEPSGKRAAFEPSGKRAAFEPSGKRATFEPDGQRASFVQSGDFQTQVTFVEKALSMCKDEGVRAWITQEGYTDAFLDLVDLFKLMMTSIEERFQEGSIVSREFDIVLVAHGNITGHMIPSVRLRPVDQVLDVVLYQPWNCTIEETVAYGIASGTIQQELTEATCDNSCPFSDVNHKEYHTQLNQETCDASSCAFLQYKGTNHKHQFNSTRPAGRSTWNLMSETSGNVPEIYLGSLKLPTDGAWEAFKILKRNNPYSDRNRVLIPFILPQLRGRRVPFSLVTLALSMVLKFSRLRARLHLVACLGKAPGSELDMEALRRQYYVADDNTMMKSTQNLNTDSFTEEDRQVYKMFRDLFGEGPGSDQA